MSLDIDIENTEALKQQLQFLKLPKGRRKQLHRWLAAAIATKSRQRRKAQTDLEGRKFTPRKSSSNKSKMFPNLAKTKFMRPWNVTEHGAEITWPKNKAGMVARVHHEGQKIRVSKKTERAITGAKCSEWQARSLIIEGFRLRLPGGKTKRVSKKWLKENMSAEQAGVILRYMRDEASKPKNSWEIKVPARPFLGASKREQKEMSTKLLNQMMEQIKR